MFIPVTFHPNIRYQFATLFANYRTPFLVKFLLCSVGQLLFGKSDQNPFRCNALLFRLVVKLQRNDTVVIVGVLFAVPPRTFRCASNAAFAGSRNDGSRILHNRKSGTGRSRSDGNAILLSLTGFMFECIKFVDFSLTRIASRNGYVTLRHVNLEQKRIKDSRDKTNLYSTYQYTEDILSHFTEASIHQTPVAETRLQTHSASRHF